MRILVLGGSVFLSREVAVQSLARGHTVTCACRGTGGELPAGAEHVVLDRLVDTDPSAGPWAELAERSWDAVVDVARTPSWVRTALFALAGNDAHWVFVSSVSAYADLSVPGGSTTDTPVLEPAEGDMDDRADATAYGRNKVACEEAVRSATGARGLIARAGLIVGPHDRSGRFTYWPARLARGGPVLVPEPPVDPVQVIDVRDLAGWLVDTCEGQVSGTFDACGPVLTRQQMIEEVAAGVGVRPELVWADPAELERLDVRPWAGPRSLPVWLPPGEHSGMAHRDTSAVTTAGLRTRPLSETARDVIAWVRQDPDAVVGGLTAEEEAEVLHELQRAGGR